MIKIKKSEGLSLSVVVIAAVALIVLVVLVLIFSGKLELFNAGVKTCPPGSEEMTREQLEDIDVPDGMCPGNKLPVKAVGDGSELRYCCPINEG